MAWLAFWISWEIALTWPRESTWSKLNFLWKSDPSDLLFHVFLDPKPKIFERMFKGILFSMFTTSASTIMSTSSTTGAFLSSIFKILSGIVLFAALNNYSCILTTTGTLSLIPNTSKIGSGNPISPFYIIFTTSKVSSAPPTFLPLSYTA